MYQKNIENLLAGLNAAKRFTKDPCWEIVGNTIVVRGQFSCLNIPAEMRDRLKKRGWEVGMFDMTLHVSVTDLDYDALVMTVTDLLKTKLSDSGLTTICNSLGCDRGRFVEDVIERGKTMQLVLLAERECAGLFKHYQREREWLVSYGNKNGATDILSIAP